MVKHTKTIRQLFANEVFECVKGLKWVYLFRQQ